MSALRHLLSYTFTSGATAEVKIGALTGTDEYELTDYTITLTDTQSHIEHGSYTTRLLASPETNANCIVSSLDGATDSIGWRWGTQEDFPDDEFRRFAAAVCDAIWRRILADRKDALSANNILLGVNGRIWANSLGTHESVAVPITIGRRRDTLHLVVETGVSDIDAFAADVRELFEAAGIPLDLAPCS